MFYTYVHANQDGIVFYVGKGSGRRVYSMKDRSWEWQEELKKHDGLLMKIVKRFDTEIEAFNHEQELISKYRSDGLLLVNKNDGGAGPNGYIFTEARKQHISQIMTGYKHKEVTCPHCGKVGGATTMKRWHFDNCNGLKPYKLRITVLGKRIYLGYHETKEKADAVAKEFYDFIMEEYQAMKTVVIPSGSVWTVI